MNNYKIENYVDNKCVFFEVNDLDESIKNQIEEILQNENLTLFRFENNGFYVDLDKDGDFIPSAISKKNEDELIKIINKKYLNGEDREKVLFGFNNAGNLNIEKDWTDTLEKKGEDLYLQAFYEEYYRILRRDVEPEIIQRVQKILDCVLPQK
ncbi:hypothetical protein [Desulfoplanes formicivorans]|uniref:Uncharacterized protein n=1 Tax=Desulfoplanes formicivorans TaxID=1592317 RepID=A0A194AG00_9BACT|nr:hypothetical protein [Desulfoplanes formicivorans]GAU08258.1 hypothetical protein DPF_0961 [Desulfoplanes formicivorans]